MNENTEIEVSVNLNFILKGLGNQDKAGGLISFDEEDIERAMGRIDSLFARTDPLDTTAVISGWSPGWLNYNIMKHVCHRSCRQYRITTEGQRIEVF